MTGARARRLALLAALLAPAPLAAQARLAVERAGPPRVEVDPGGQASAAFRVRNALGGPAAEEAALPAGWTRVSAPASSPLAPGQSALRIVAAVPPRGARAGTYVLRYTLRAPGAAAGDSVLVAVRERRALRVEVAQAPRFAAAGRGFVVEFEVWNDGNAPAQVRLAAGGGMRAEPASAALGPGERRVVRVHVPAPPSAARVHPVTLRAVAGNAEATATAAVPVVAPGARTSPAAGGLPVRAAVHAGGGRGGLPAELTASGPLGRAGAHLDVRVLGRGAAAAELGEREQLSLALRGRRAGIRVGHHGWSLSPLTMGGRYGFGWGGTAAAGPLAVDAFAVRGTEGARGAAGGSLAVGGTRASLAAGYLARAGEGAVATLRGRARPLPGLGADLEYGRAAGGGAGRALYAHVYGAGRRWTVDAGLLRADTTYPGEGRGTASRRASAALRPLPALRLHAAYAQNARSPMREARYATESRSLRAGAMLGGVTLEWRGERRAGDAPTGPYARLSRSWLASGALHARGRSLSGGVEMGTVADSASGRAEPFHRAWAGFHAARGAGSAWGTLEVRGSGEEPGAAPRSLSGTLGLAVEPLRGTRLSLAASGGAAAWPDEPRGIVDATAEQRLPRGHALRLRLRAAPRAEPGARRPVLLLDYAVPLRVPVGGEGGAAGVVRGRVVEAGTGRPLAGTLLRVGGRLAVTDARGRWRVDGLPPGEHVVEVDPLSLGVERVPVQRDALSVHVGPRGARPLEIEVAPGAGVDGSLTLPDSGGVAGAAVELRRGAQRVHATTDARGRFSLRGMAPGAWTLVVVRAELPPHHYLEADSLAVELAPGGTARVPLRVLQRQREMRMLGGGRVVLNEGPAAPAPALVVPPPPAAPAAPEAAPAAAPSAPRVADPAPAPAPALAGGPEPYVAPVGPRPARWRNPTYIVQPSDAGLEGIALRVYGDRRYWVRLWLGNRAHLPTPGNVRPQLVLAVPAEGPLTPQERAALRVWRARR